MAKQKQRPAVKKETTDQPVVYGEQQQEAASPSVMVRHGIHSGTFPIRGKTVAQVRSSVKNLLNVGDNAKAVLNGEIVDPEKEDTTMVGNDVTLLNFVAESSVKGATQDKDVNVEMYEEDGQTWWTMSPETLVCSKGRVYPVGVCEQTQSLDKSASLGTVLRKYASYSVHGMQDQPLPSAVRWHVKRQNVDVFILEFDPCIQRLKWSETGSSSDYKYRTLAFPYVIMKVTFKDGSITGDCELFCRALPLRSTKDRIAFAPLLNVSPYSYKCYAWFCTQYLSKEQHDGTLVGQLQAIIKHLWGGGFNRSSEQNEGQSSYGLLQANNFDDRITDIAKWEQCTAEDPRFVHDVKWWDVTESASNVGKPTGRVTVQALIEKTLDRHTKSDLTDDLKLQKFLRSHVIRG